MSLHEHGPVVKARCCRTWPVVIGQPMGRCGICGERPRITSEEVDVDE